MFAAAAVLIVFRSLVCLWFEQAYFDSDQAIVGLMAKHLSEGRAFPLFFYGQAYMLGVEAWWTVPFFWLAGPSVAALRASLVGLNLVAAALLLVSLEHDGQLRPWPAVLASVTFLLAPLPTSMFLVEAQGGNIEPFVYVVALWILRTRPFWFGAVLAIGFLNREFTLYVVPILLAGQLLAGGVRVFARDHMRRWALSVVAFAGTWELVHSLEIWADMLGPGTRGTLLRGFSGSQVTNLLDRFNWAPTEIPGRLWTFVIEVLPSLLGLRATNDVVAAHSHDWATWPLATAGVMIGGRLIWLVARTGADSVRRAGFAWYLVGVGLLASVMYVIGKPVNHSSVRYALLALLIPTGAMAAFFMIETDRRFRAAAAFAIAAWVTVAAYDHASLIIRYVGSPPSNDVRQLGDALVARGVTTAEAPYWRAYKLTFITRERLVVASSDFVRIDAYQRLAAQQGERLISISETPCPGAERVGSWYLCTKARDP